MEKIENLNICEKCGGLCCKKSGCDYFVSDFETFKLEYLEERLKEGYISIIASLSFSRANDGKLCITPILSMRARNKGRDIIDLLSMKTTCMSLTSKGCRYTLDERPSGGACLIPSSEELCYSTVDRLKELEKWLPHQKVLQRIVKRYTGKTVNAKLREDVLKLFEDLYNKKFDGVSGIELLDIKSMLPYLIEFYPEEYKTVVQVKKKILS